MSSLGPLLFILLDDYITTFSFSFSLPLQDPPIQNGVSTLTFTIDTNTSSTSRNQLKCNHFISQLHATCSHLRLSLGVFTTIRSNFNYFGHSYNYDATIVNFILPIWWLLDLFSSMNILICPISRNSHQISQILKVFYNDIGVYFYVCIKITFMTYYINHKYIFVCILIMCMYVYCSYIESKN